MFILFCYQFTLIAERDIEHLQNWYEELLVKLRPNAVGLVDAFDLRDEVRISYASMHIIFVENL